MENTTKNAPKRPRDVYYYRQRYKNRVFAALSAFFAEEAERTGVTKKDIAARLTRDPAQISRWLSQPGNLTLETVSDLLLALDAEGEPPTIVRFADRTVPNYAHPLVARVLGRIPPIPTPPTATATATITTASQPLSPGFHAEARTRETAKAKTLELV